MSEMNFDKTLKAAEVSKSTLNDLLSDSPYFVMSKYMTIEDLYKDKAEYYQNRYQGLLAAINDDFDWLIENLKDMVASPETYALADHEGIPYSITMFESVLNTFVKGINKRKKNGEE